MVAVGAVVNDTSGPGSIDTANERTAGVWSPRNAGPPGELPHVGGVFTMAPKTGSGLVSAPAPGAETVDPRPRTESAICLAWRRGVCLETQGFQDTSVASRDDPARVATVETIFGPARWRREIAAFQRSVSPGRTRMHGRPADFLAASPASGNDSFLQWEDPRGVNIIVSGPGADFTKSQLIELAENLRIVRETTPVGVAVAKVDGVLPRGVVVAKTDEYKRGEFSFLTRGSITSAGVGCLGLGARSICTSFPVGRPSAALVGDSGLVVAGAVPSDTDHIVVRLPDGKRITDAPARSGPAPGLRYFAHWLPSEASTPLRVTALDKHGTVLAQLNVG